MNLRTTLLVFLCFCATTVLRAERVDMLKAGAKANGKTLNTKLINSTIDRLNRGGGCTLFFPAGTYLTGSIHLKSNITRKNSIHPFFPCPSKVPSPLIVIFSASTA